MKPKIFFLIAFLNCFISIGQPNNQKELCYLMRAANETGIFNGNIIISKKSEIIYLSQLGYTDYTKSKKLNYESSMPIGSISKEFNGVAILFLKEKGKLKLEDRISDYLTYLPEWANEIQIKHLLQYTSGLPRISKNTNDEYLSELKKIKKLEFTPGNRYLYSNANIFLQQEIIKKISSLSYPDFLKENLFKPLGIEGGEIPKGAILSLNMAGSFDNDYKETSFIHDGGEMYFTNSDLYYWVKGLHEGKLINQNSLNILAQSFDLNSESSLGNVVLKKGKILEHSHQGSGNNYESYIFYSKKDDIIITMITNNQNFKLPAIAESIINILNDKAYTVPKKSIYLAIRGKLLDNYDSGITFYNHIKSNEKDQYDFSNETLDLVNTGKYLMRRDKYDDAIKILKISATTIDLSNLNKNSDIYTLIGECYLKNKNTEMATVFYKKALELDTTNKLAVKMLKEILNK
ncbi:serine hydrolase [Flavobacterium sp. LS1R47]|uniref:Serine hydrolase n=1 Tax=Flavobacterium frigoritolerans TaxID=2987686 RepID=A0A9X2YZL5_9FLAO|nr:serine hydrolase [Flavobacterium frigoritolerans]MCV9931789.1 serine hydrolase [Flavobacterium frigoritolerans]